MTTDIKPIETRYAGCRFRSRLEARWAVFFDALGIAWEYEPQGYLVDGEPYLPDFWLPGAELWAEVKGVLSHRDMQRLMKACGSAGLPDSPGAESRPDPTDRDTWGERMLLLGPIPEPGSCTHSMLSYLAGEVYRVAAFFADVDGQLCICPLGRYMRETGWPQIEGDDETLTAKHRAALVGSPADPMLAAFPTVAAAYRAARSARFEHGEVG